MGSGRSLPAVLLALAALTLLAIAAEAKGAGGYGPPEAPGGKAQAPERSAGKAPETPRGPDAHLPAERRGHPEPSEDSAPAFPERGRAEPSPHSGRAREARGGEDHDPEGPRAEERRGAERGSLVRHSLASAEQAAGGTSAGLGKEHGRGATQGVPGSRGHEATALPGRALERRGHGEPQRPEEQRGEHRAAGESEGQGRGAAKHVRDNTDEEKERGRADRDQLRSGAREGCLHRLEARALWPELPGAVGVHARGPHAEGSQAWPAHAGRAAARAPDRAGPEPAGTRPAPRAHAPGPPPMPAEPLPGAVLLASPQAELALPLLDSPAPRAPPRRQATLPRGTEGPEDGDGNAGAAAEGARDEPATLDLRAALTALARALLPLREALGLAPLLAGFRHLHPGNVLEHGYRREILRLVRAEPGVHLREVARRLGLTATNASHHLRQLERHGFVRGERFGRRLLWFPGGARAERDRLLADALLRHGRRALLLKAVLDHPGATQLGLAGLTRQPQGTAAWHLRRLLAAGLVEERREGGACRCRATARGFAAVQASPPEPGPGPHLLAPAA